ncbi:amidohydrolase family protein [Streptomyces sp. NL15-2K]|uniref:amidohydrolase family protein n=1 Tax=Streptomyces sp. NL15-2K TaxID=376149 RepID=UPI000F55D20C|nr:MULTISPECIES: amidohydrolase family protein [Actinomycetes]WKX12682.1 amidohydrolase family protein [Kutzneria buriramensis]GCB43104.1 2-amino-3-carboxymuconate 6-semialdehyde decarboxylase [Streptomyces sp. NL15-2K]
MTSAAFDGPAAGRVDVHHHFTAPAWLDWAEQRGVIHREKLPWWTRWDLNAALELMDKAGIATSVMTVAMLGRLRERTERQDSARVALRAAADVVESHPARFRFFTPVFLDDLELSLWSLEYGLDELGAVGVSTRTSMDGVYLGDETHDRLLRELNDRSAVVSTHPMDVPAGKGGAPGSTGLPGMPPFVCDFLVDTTRAAINLIKNGTLDRYPNLTFILPHGGGFLPYMATRLELFGGHLTPEIEPGRVRDYLHRFYFDTAGPMSPSATPTLMATVDPGHILFGTDWPPTPAQVIADITTPALDNDPVISDQQLQGINRDNAVRLMPELAR